MSECTESLNRISAYLNAKKEVSGLHPEVIHVIHANSGKHELRVSDLEAAIAAMGDCPKSTLDNGDSVKQTGDSFAQQGEITLPIESERTVLEHLYSFVKARDLDDGKYIERSIHTLLRHVNEGRTLAPESSESPIISSVYDWIKDRNAKEEWDASDPLVITDVDLSDCWEAAKNSAIKPSYSIDNLISDASGMKHLIESVRVECGRQWILFKSPADKEIGDMKPVLSVQTVEQDLAEYIEGYETMKPHKCRVWAMQIMSSVIKPWLQAAGVPYVG